MVYRYECRDCGMVHCVSMTEEQHAQIVKCPRDVHYLLPQLQGCFKTMIHRGTCPRCEGVVKPK